MTTTQALALTILLAATGASADEIDHQPSIPLAPEAGKEIGYVFQAWLSPEQEGGEERDAPRLTPQVFLSTLPSVDREDRPSYGYGLVEFPRDMSSAFVTLSIGGIDPATINMIHLHCGRPGQLGPILVDLGLEADLPRAFADGVASFEITNADLVAVTDHGHGLVGAFTAGCPIITGVPMDRIDTIAGMFTVAAEGELYFNVHTEAQTFFGDMRGQLQPVE